MSWNHHQLLCGWPETLPADNIGDRCATVDEVLQSLAMPTSVRGDTKLYITPWAPITHHKLGHLDLLYMVILVQLSFTTSGNLFHLLHTTLFVYRSSKSVAERGIGRQRWIGAGSSWQEHCLGHGGSLLSWEHIRHRLTSTEASLHWWLQCVEQTAST